MYSKFGYNRFLRQAFSRKSSAGMGCLGSAADDPGSYRCPTAFVKAARADWLFRGNTPIVTRAATKSFKETVRARAMGDPDFRLAFIREAIAKLVDGDVESGLSILGDYVNATVGYKTLAARTGKNPKSLMRMLGPAGNPTAENLFSVIKQLKEQEGLEFDIRARHA